MVISKNSVSDFVYLYGCEVDDLPVSYEDRLKMHKEQRNKAIMLLSRLMEPKYADRDNERINDVIKCIGWNESMLQKLKKDKPCLKQ